MTNEYHELLIEMIKSPDYLIEYQGDYTKVRYSEVRFVVPEF
ncbi:hypothetical protein RV12_GL000749 [Enterococcus quebecensis]|nr:hypothetical protein RV12_GL000749 [Enterococcus quebecensis]